MTCHFSMSRIVQVSITLGLMVLLEGAAIFVFHEHAALISIAAVLINISFLERYDPSKTDEY